MTTAGAVSLARRASPYHRSSRRSVTGDSVNVTCRHLLAVICWPSFSGCHFLAAESPPRPATPRAQWWPRSGPARSPAGRRNARRAGGRGFRCDFAVTGESPSSVPGRRIGVTSDHRLPQRRPAPAAASSAFADPAPAAILPAASAAPRGLPSERLGRRGMFAIAGDHSCRRRPRYKCLRRSFTARRRCRSFRLWPAASALVPAGRFPGPRRWRGASPGGWPSPRRGSPQPRSGACRGCACRGGASRGGACRAAAAVSEIARAAARVPARSPRPVSQRPIRLSPLTPANTAAICRCVPETPSPGNPGNPVSGNPVSRKRRGSAR
jgi:hypothetical protein